MHICNRRDTHNVVYNMHSTHNRIHTNLQHDNQYDICNMIIESNVCNITQTTHSIHTMHMLKYVQYTLCVTHSNSVESIAGTMGSLTHSTRRTLCLRAVT